MKIFCAFLLKREIKAMKFLNHKNFIVEIVIFGLNQPDQLIEFKLSCLECLEAILKISHSLSRICKKQSALHNSLIKLGVVDSLDFLIGSTNNLVYEHSLKLKLQYFEN